MAGREVNKRKSRRPQSLRPSIAVVVDGETEKWYIEQLKKLYNPDVTRSIKITPQLPDVKKVSELFDYARQMVDESYTKVFLIVDLDVILKNEEETRRFVDLYNRFLDPTESNAWMRNVCVIVNSPCLEYWYLLHFNNTTRFFPDYDSLKNDLRKCDDLMKDYVKKDAFYNNAPGLFAKLLKYLPTARGNAKAFDLEGMEERGGSEMYKLFDFIDKL